MVVPTRATSQNCGRLDSLTSKCLDASSGPSADKFAKACQWLENPLLRKARWAPGSIDKQRIKSEIDPDHDSQRLTLVTES